MCSSDLLLATQRVSLPPKDEPHEADWLSGAAILIRTTALESAGLFDEQFFLDFGDVDFGRRIAGAGWTSWCLPVAEAVHDPIGAGPARRPEHWFAARKRYYEKYHGEAHAALADVLYAGSLAVNKVRQSLRGQDTTPPHLITDLLGFGLRHALTR